MRSKLFVPASRPELFAKAMAGEADVNGLATPHFESDLEAIVGPGLDLVNLPKPESADDVRRCAAAIARLERGTPEEIGILVNIE